MGFRSVVPLFFVVFGAAQNCCPHNALECPVDKPHWQALTLPDGFCISHYAHIPDGARNVEAFDTEEFGTIVVVATLGEYTHVLIDANQDGTVDRDVVISTGASRRHTATMRNGELYIVSGSRILRIDNLFDMIRNNAEPNLKVLYEGFGTGNYHDNRAMAWGRDDSDLYFALGSPCNTCIPEDAGECDVEDCNHGTIVYVEDIASKDFITFDDIKIYARGIRNSVGLAMHPETNVLWFTDNGRDEWGNDRPGDELNVAPKPGIHFGFPYCYGYNETDGDFNVGECASQPFYEPAFQELGPHVAALGLEFSQSQSFPPPYNQGIFIAEHGSWNRQPFIGFRVTHVNVDDGEYTTFLDGFLTNPQFGTRTGRPTDVAFLPDGSLIVSDDLQHLVFRIHYEGTKSKYD